MSDYCTIDDITPLITGFIINDQTQPSIEQVNTKYIPDRTRYINDRLGKYYVTPITGADALITINRIAKWLVAADISDNIYMGQTPSNSPQARTWEKKAENDLTRIINGEIILTDAVPTNDTPETMNQMISDRFTNSGCRPPSKFSIGMKF